MTGDLEIQGRISYASSLAAAILQNLSFCWMIEGQRGVALVSHSRRVEMGTDRCHEITWFGFTLFRTLPTLTLNVVRVSTIAHGVMIKP